MNIRKRLREKSEVHTSALNDILFILLFFFLIIATLANPNVIKLANPKAESDTREKQTVVVSIDADQKLYVDASPASWDSLTQILQVKIQNSSSEDQPVVVINTDKMTTAENIVNVMRAAKSLNARSVLSVSKP